jgi:hypothetical protein
MVRRRCRDTRSTYNHLPCALRRQHALVRERNSMNCQTVHRVPASEKSCAVIYHGIHSLFEKPGCSMTTCSSLSHYRQIKYSVPSQFPAQEVRVILFSVSVPKDLISSHVSL